MVRGEERQRDARKSQFSLALFFAAHPCSCSMSSSFSLLLALLTNSSPDLLPDHLAVNSQSVAMKRQQPSMVFYPSSLCDPVQAADVSHFQTSLKALTSSPKLVIKKAQLVIFPLVF